MQAGHVQMLKIKCAPFTWCRLSTLTRCIHGGLCRLQVRAASDVPSLKLRHADHSASASRQSDSRQYRTILFLLIHSSFGLIAAAGTLNRPETWWRNSVKPTHASAGNTKAQRALTVPAIVERPLTKLRNQEKWSSLSYSLGYRALSCHEAPVTFN